MRTHFLVVAAMLAGCAGGSSPFEKVPPAVSGDIVWNDVWVSSPTDVWALGNGLIYHYDGMAWTQAQTSERPGVIAIWGAAPNALWAVGGDKIWSWNGTAWSGVDPPVTGGNLAAISGSSATDVWAVGDNGASVHFDGTTWRRRGIAGSFTESLYVAGPADAWTCGVTDFKRWNGSSWVDIRSEADHYSAVGVFGFSKNDVWAVGDDDAMMHWDGARWTPFPIDEDRVGDHNTAWGAAPNDVWSVGDLGLVSHFDGNKWSRVSSGTDRPLLAVHGKDREVWAVGFGVILRLQQ